MRTPFLMEPIGALSREVVDANSLKDMVGPWGLEPQTTVSKLFSDCKALRSFIAGPLSPFLFPWSEPLELDSLMLHTLRQNSSERRSVYERCGREHLPREQEDSFA